MEQKKNAEIVPAATAASPMVRRGPGWLEHEFETIFDDFRRSFDTMLSPYFPIETRLQELGLEPVRAATLDFIDEGAQYVIHAELPGFTRENVEVEVNRDGVSIRAMRDEKTEDKKKNYLRRERVYSSFERSVSFPEEVNPGKAEGSMKDGVLELKIPKKEPKPEVKPKKIELK